MPVVVKRVTSNVDLSASAGILQNISDLSFNVMAGDVVFYNFAIHWDAGTNIGIRFGINGPSGTIRTGSIQSNSTTSAEYRSLPGLNTVLLASTSGINSPDSFANLHGVYIASADGTLVFQACNEGSGAITIYENSSATFIVQNVFISAGSGSYGITGSHTGPFNFPVLHEITSTNSTVDANNYDANLNATVNNGDLLIAIGVAGGISDPGTLSAPGGWTKLGQHVSNGNHALLGIVRKADGSESGGTVNFNFVNTALDFAAQVFRFQTGTWRDSGTILNDIESSFILQSGTSTPNPPSINPTNWEYEATYWITGTCTGQSAEITAAPANYGNLTVATTGGGGNHAELTTTTRQVATFSEDPGVFTANGSVNWCAFTIAIRPHAAGTNSELDVDSGTYSITGTEATLRAAYKITADSGSYSANGTAVNLLKASKVSADSGTYATTGTDAALKHIYPIAAESGTYGVTGTAAGLFSHYRLVAESGSYVTNGTTASLEKDSKLSADSGLYALNGTAANLLKSFPLTAESGDYSVTGTATSLLRHLRLTADSGNYSVSGVTASLEKDSKLTANSGSYSTTGTAVNLSKGFVISAQSGLYATTGAAVTLKADRKIQADSGAYAELGQNASLTAERILSANTGDYAVNGEAAELTHGYSLTAESGLYSVAGSDATFSIANDIVDELTLSSAFEQTLSLTATYESTITAIQIEE